MSDNDDILRKALQKSQSEIDGEAPDFKTIFGAAERQSRARQRNQRVGLAAAAVVAVVALSLLPVQEDELIYVDVEQLTATTSWSAPSDSLLPEYQFDLYRDLPRLFESTDMSTNTDEGALL